MSGLTENEAKEFHGIFVSSFVIFTIIAVIALFIAVWYAAEALLALNAGWQLSTRSIAIWILRDALLPVLWIAAWAGNEFEWRGNAMTVADAYP